jgi:hypothetical protein
MAALTDYCLNIRCHTTGTRRIVGQKTKNNWRFRSTRHFRRFHLRLEKGVDYGRNLIAIRLLNHCWLSLKMYLRLILLATTSKSPTFRREHRPAGHSIYQLTKIYRYSSTKLRYVYFILFSGCDLMRYHSDSY